MYDLSTIILSYNDRELLEKCLKSYEGIENPPTSEVIVVDNGSTDGSLEMLHTDFPNVRVIRNPKNVGVARARNQGAREARGKHLFFLDSDTEINRDVISTLFGFMEENMDVAVAGPKLINPDGSLQYSCRTFPTPLTFFMRGLKIGKRNRFMRRHLMEGFDHNSRSAVDWMIGASWMMRREAVEDVGLFDEKYFFGYEDPDYCYRAGIKGWKIAYIPDAVVTHHYRRRSARGWIFNRLKWSHAKSALRFFWKKYIRGFDKNTT